MTGNQPLVTVVTPSFNQAQFLEQAILSVLEQDYPQVEYMVVDGASTDGSVEIIRKYAGRLAWWVSEQDSGQAEAINKGLRRARGAVVAWLNSDDLYLPGAIRSAVAALEARPRAGLVYGETVSIDEHGQTINLPRYRQFTMLDLLSFNIIGQPAVFMRRAAMGQAGYLDPDYHYLLDHQLWLRFASMTEVCHVPQRWAAARSHPAAKNRAGAANFGAEAFRILEWAAGQPAMTSILESHHRRVRAGAYRIDGFYQVEGGQVDAGLKAYWLGLLLHPPTVLKDWRRITYALACKVGLGSLRERFLCWRRKHLHNSDGGMV